MRQNPKAPAVQVLFALLGLLLVVGAYVLVMHFTVHSTEVRAAYTADQRDATYAVLHLVFLAATVVVGFLLGKWLNGQGVAYAAFFFLVMATSMVFLQLGSQTLACHGHNDIIVHWTC